MKLYEITTGLLALWTQVEEIIDPENAPNTEEQALALKHLEGEISKLEGSHSEKCLNVACLIKNLEASSVALKTEEEKLAKRRKSADRQAEWLKLYLQGNMEAGVVVKDARTVIGWRKSAGVVLLCKPEELPEAFRRTKIVIDADKTAIKDVLSTDPKNEELAGKALIENRNNIQIK